jgi:hypothetical protein
MKETSEENDHSLQVCHGVVVFGVHLAEGLEAPRQSMFGQFYVGVTTLSPAELGTASWQKGGSSTERNIWAVHSVSHSQLPHCNTAVFCNEPFTFSQGMSIFVTVDRERGTLSLSCNGKCFSDVFTGIPIRGIQSFSLMNSRSDLDLTRNANQARIEPMYSGESSTKTVFKVYEAYLSALDMAFSGSLSASDTSSAEDIVAMCPSWAYWQWLSTTE